MRPSSLQSGLIFFWIKLSTTWAVGGGQGPEQVHREHVDNLHSQNNDMLENYSLVVLLIPRDKLALSELFCFE